MEGYVYASDQDGVTSSVPYSGFIGNRDRLDVFDDGYYNYSSVNGATYFSSNVYEGMNRFDVILGSNNYTDYSLRDARFVSFSPDGDGYADILNLNFTLNRDVSAMDFAVYDAKGELVQKLYSAYPVMRSYSNSAEVKQYSVEIWNGCALDNKNYVFPEGEYYLVCRALPKGSDIVQTVVMPFTLDITPPSIDSYIIEEIDGRIILTVNLSDNGYVQNVFLYGSDEKFGYIYESLPENPLDRNMSFSFDVTDFEGTNLYFESVDYAYNVNIERIFITLK